MTEKYTINDMGSVSPADIKKAIDEVKSISTINLDLRNVIEQMCGRYVQQEKIKLLERLTTMSEDITIKEEKDTKYGTVVTRKKIDVIRVSEIEKLIKQLEDDHEIYS